MMKKISIVLLALSFCVLQKNEAQSIARSTLCGAGATWSNNTGSLSSTFGQCPGCGTYSTNSGTLTVGFQQPSGKACFTSTFEYTEITDGCGTVFNFNYIGNADPPLVNFEWDFGDDGFPQTSTLASPEGVAFSSTGLKTVNLTITDGACEVMAILDVIVPATGFATNPIVTPVNCAGGENGAIAIDVMGGSPPFSYTWSTGNLSESIDGLTEGDYAYTLTDANGCESTNTASLFALSDTIYFEALTTDETCEGDEDGGIEVAVTGGTPPLSLAWNNGETTPNLSNLRSDNYTLTVTDGNGCTEILEINIGQMCDPAIVDVVSPNGDGINDIWIIEGIESFPDNEVAIVNRWGQEVWRKKGYTNDWAGTNNDGELLPVGAYFYVIMLNNTNNDVLSGSITIVR